VVRIVVIDDTGEHVVTGEEFNRGRPPEKVEPESTEAAVHGSTDPEI
jgi:hypothetical protein